MLLFLPAFCDHHWTGNSRSRVLEVECSPRGIELDNRFMSLGVYPIGIDPDHVAKTLRKKWVQNRINEVRHLAERSIDQRGAEIGLCHSSVFSFGLARRMGVSRSACLDKPCLWRVSRRQRPLLFHSHRACVAFFAFVFRWGRAFASFLLKMCPLMSWWCDVVGCDVGGFPCAVT